MGKLLEAIHAIPPTPHKNGACKIGMYLQTLDPETVDDLKVGLDSNISKAGLSALLRGFHIDVGATLIAEHRLKRCNCYRATS